MSIKKELETLRENSSDLTQSVRNVAKLIRNELKTTHTEDLSWPPNPEELDKDYLPLTPFATLFLTTLISCDPDKPATSRIQRLVLSIFQDLMFAVSEGTCPTAKHVLLPWTVKTLTGNVELIKMLNRFGHGISYSKLEEIETALCLQEIENVNEMGVAPPLNVYPRVPTTLAFDNIDRLEETLSGGGTSHRVNGIAVQPMVHTVQAPKPPTSMPKQRKRSIDHVEYAPPSYNAGQRVGPPLVKRLRIDCSEDVKIAEMKNLTWCVVRQINEVEQNMCSWTGFNIVTRNNITVKQDTVAYLTTINAPATAMSTVNEVLKQALKIKESLEIVCVFDQAFYAKAAYIVWKHPDTFQSIVPRLGMFHTICNFQGIIGKRFRDAGLRDLAVESEVIAEGSVDRVLDGHQYNRGIRLHKLVYESLQCLAWKRFPDWIEKTQPAEQRSLLDEVQPLFSSLHQDTTQENLEDVLQNPQFARFFDLYQEYLSFLRSDAGSLAEFWMLYVDMVETLLHLIRASREGNWLLHLHAVRAALPWFFA